LIYFFLLIYHLPPRSTLFPYTTLFRSFSPFLAFILFSGIHLLPHFDKSTRKKAFPMHTAARRILPALLLLLALLVSALPRALARSEEHTSELQSRFDLVCRLLLEKKNH